MEGNEDSLESLTEDLKAEDTQAKHSSTVASEESTKPSAEGDTQEIDDLLALMQQGKSAQTPATRFGCLKKMLYGKCDKPSCKYSHNEDTVRQTAKDLNQKLEAFLRIGWKVSTSRSIAQGSLRWFSCLTGERQSTNG